MALFDLFKKYYTVTVRCYNCGFSQECRIPKGNTIDSWLSTSTALCSNCGNPTLRRIEIVKAPLEVQKPIKEYAHSQYSSMKNQPMSPSKKLIQSGEWTQEQQKRVKQEVKYPVKEPVISQEPEQKKEDTQFDFNPKQKKVNFWTGKETEE